MVPIDTPPPIPASSPDNEATDETEDARWLAGLIKALQSNAERQGYPEVVTALDAALDAAQAIADSKGKH